MKKLLLIAVLIAACLSATAYVACVAAPLLGKNIKGSGKIRRPISTASKPRAP